MSLLDELPSFVEKDDKVMEESSQEKNIDKSPKEYDFSNVIEAFCDKLNDESLFLGVEVQSYVLIE